MIEQRPSPLQAGCPVSPNSYTWHRHTSSPTENPLLWTFLTRTLDEETKIRTSSEVNFEEFGVTNPLLARALIGLVEIEFINPDQLGKILTSHQNRGVVIDPESTHSLSDLLITAMPNLTREDLYSVHVPLGADLINHPLNAATSLGVRSLFAFLDAALLHPQGIEAIDAYVEYYSKSVELLHTRGEAVIKYLNDAQPERRFLITHAPIRKVLAHLQKQPGTLGDAELIAGEAAFQTFRATFQRFLPVYAAIMNTDIQPSTYIDSQHRQFSTQFTEKLWSIYLEELRSGIHSAIRDVPRGQRNCPLPERIHARAITHPINASGSLVLMERTTSTVGGQLIAKHNVGKAILQGVTYSGESIYMQPPGACPAFRVGWQTPIE